MINSPEYISLLGTKQALIIYFQCNAVNVALNAITNTLLYIKLEFVVKEDSIRARAMSWPAPSDL